MMVFLEYFVTYRNTKGMDTFSKFYQKNDRKRGVSSNNKINIRKTRYFYVNNIDIFDH